MPDSGFRLNEATDSPDSATWLFYPETHAPQLSLLRFPYIFLICNQDSSESIFVLFKERDSSYSPSLLRSSYNLIFHSVSLHYRIKQTRFKVLCKMQDGTDICAKCRMVLTYDAYSETVIEHQEKEDQILGHFKSYSAMVFVSIPRIQTTIQIQVSRK